MNQIWQIGPLTIHYYGLILGLAMSVGWWWFDRIGSRVGIPEKLRSQVIVGGIIGGMVGARLYHVVDYWYYYGSHLTEIWFLWQGGLGIWGAVAGGVIGAWYVVRSEGFLKWRVFDVAAVIVPLAQAIGRWGNFVNYELYGKPTNLPWAQFIPPAYRLPKLANQEYYHPLFLYESLLLSLLFGGLWLLARKVGYGKGYLLGSYLIGYGSIRFLLEPLRIDPWTAAGIPMAQLVSGGAVLAGFGLMVSVGLKHGKEAAKVKGTKQ